MSIETTYAFSDNVENATLSAGPTDAFTVKAENPYVCVGALLCLLTHHHTRMSVTHVAFSHGSLTQLTDE